MTDRELTRRLAEKIMDWEIYTEQDGEYTRWQRRPAVDPQRSCFIDLDGRAWRYDGTAYTDCAEQPWQPLHDMNHAMMVADALHSAIDPARLARHSYLALVCVGHFGDRWCASFAHNLAADWFEHVTDYPFSVCVPTPARAICLAANLTLESES